MRLCTTCTPTTIRVLIYTGCPTMFYISNIDVDLIRPTLFYSSTSYFMKASRRVLDGRGISPLQ